MYVDCCCCSRLRIVAPDVQLGFVGALVEHTGNIVAVVAAHLSHTVVVATVRLGRIAMAASVAVQSWHIGAAVAAHLEYTEVVVVAARLGRWPPWLGNILKSLLRMTGKQYHCCSMVRRKSGSSPAGLVAYMGMQRYRRIE